MRILLRLALPALCIALCGLPVSPRAQTRELPARSEPSGETRVPLAELRGRTLYVDEIEGALAFRIYQSRLDIHSLLVGEAERRIESMLLEEAAQKAGVDVETLLAGVESASRPATDDEIDAYLALHPPEAGVDPARARERVAHYLTERARLDRRIAFMRSLREAAGARILLPAPEPPRTRFELANAPTRGPVDAPVTIVHFASLGSLHAARSAEQLDRLARAFPDRIRRAHVHLLIDRDESGLHAARLAFAAASPERFWAFHDAVYAALRREGAAIGPERLEEIARRCGFAAREIERARRDSTLLAAVKGDIDRANAAGVPREPGLFVNGLFVSGLVPYVELEAIVRRELAPAAKLRDRP